MATSSGVAANEEDLVSSHRGRHPQVSELWTPSSRIDWEFESVISKARGEDVFMQDVLSIHERGIRLVKCNIGEVFRFEDFCGRARRLKWRSRRYIRSICKLLLAWTGRRSVGFLSTSIQGLLSLEFRGRARRVKWRYRRHIRSICELLPTLRRWRRKSMGLLDNPVQGLLSP